MLGQCLPDGSLGQRPCQATRGGSLKSENWGDFVYGWSLKYKKLFLSIEAVF